MRSDLTEEQLDVITDLLAGRNMLITGEAGTGKSFLLHYLKEFMDARRIKFGVCGSTGVAAVNVGGTTLHSWAGIGLADGPASNLVQNIRNNVPAYKRIRNTEVLCLDEISMISATLFEKLDKVFRMVREQNTPFGGLQLIMFGDMLQLPPVEGGFIFLSNAWREADVRVRLLTKVFRQSDVEFSRALGKIRKGELDQPTKDFFNARANAVDPNPEILPVAITAKNSTADLINQRNLDAIESELKTFQAVDKGGPAALRLLEKCLVPKELHVKIGARVMSLINIAELEVMNGTAGVVSSWSSAGYPNVLFDNGVEVLMEPVEREIMQDGKSIGSRFQIPLRLAWAVSAHKSQGCTLDKVEIHMGEAFEPGQTYVALSRVRTKEGLFIKSINGAMLTANPVAVKFYDESRWDQVFSKDPNL
jgi:ATP-dependent DNA helicase PIF1